jgi:RNA polymerase sigma factor (sigma-70 family)
MLSARHRSTGKRQWVAMVKDIDEPELLEAAQRDGERFAAFYRHFERPVLGFFMRATGRPELAGDLAAETFARAIESLPAYDAARGRPDQWLFGIARNVLAASRRSGRVEADARRRLGMPVLVIDDHSAAAIARLGEGRGELALALAELPDEQREAIDAHVLKERGYDEIARELRCSEAVVRQRVSRGLRTLRGRLAEGR